MAPKELDLGNSLAFSSSLSQPSYLLRCSSIIFRARSLFASANSYSRVLGRPSPASPYPPRHLAQHARKSFTQQQQSKQKRILIIQYIRNATVISRSIGTTTTSRTSPKVNAHAAPATRSQVGLCCEPRQLDCAAEHGHQKTTITGQNMMQRMTLATHQARVLQRLSLRWSPGFTFSSIILTPQPLKAPKWFSSLVALAPQAQQNSYLQKPQVMWLQPLFFSMRVLQSGQKETLSLFSSTHFPSCLFIASSHVTSSPCHSSLHLKHTHVSHFGH